MLKPSSICKHVPSGRRHTREVHSGKASPCVARGQKLVSQPASVDGTATNSQTSIDDHKIQWCVTMYIVYWYSTIVICICSIIESANTCIHTTCMHLPNHTWHMISNLRSQVRAQLSAHAFMYACMHVYKCKLGNVMWCRVISCHVMASKPVCDACNVCNVSHVCAVMHAS